MNYWCHIKTGEIIGFNTILDKRNPWLSEMHGHLKNSEPVPYALSSLFSLLLIPVLSVSQDGFNCMQVEAISSGRHLGKHFQGFLGESFPWSHQSSPLMDQVTGFKCFPFRGTSLWPSFGIDMICQAPEHSAAGRFQIPPLHFIRCMKVYPPTNLFSFSPVS